MPIRDVAAMNASLDNDYGTTHGPNAPSSHDVALFVGDPMTDGVEVSGAGYARVQILAAAWMAASDGFKTPSAPVVFPDPTAAYPGTVTHVGLFAHGTSTMWDCVPLSEPLDVTAASTDGVEVIFSVYYNDAVLDAP